MYEGQSLCSCVGEDEGASFPLFSLSYSTSSSLANNSKWILRRPRSSGLQSDVRAATVACAVTSATEQTGKKTH